MTLSLVGKRVLLTGASSGIGRALAIELADHGAHLAIAARRKPLLERLADEIPHEQNRPLVIQADLGKRGEAARLAEQALRGLGAVDILVNNAGGGVGGTQWMVGDDDKAREALEINYWSPLSLIAALVPPMRERGDGAVANVTSVAQLMPMWLMGHYGASKAAYAQATETLQLELMGSGVHVLQVIPGPVATAVQGETRLIGGIDKVLDRSPLGRPEVLAKRIVRALAKGRQRLVYPRPLALPLALPGLARRYMQFTARRLADEINRDDPRVVLTGSQGDSVAREARAAWEAQQGRS